MLLKDTIYYDVKARSIHHFKALYKLAQLYKALSFDQQTKEFKSLAAYQLRTTYIPSYITIDTMIINYHVLSVKNLKDTKAFKAQGKNKLLKELKPATIQYVELLLAEIPSSAVD
jgi:predicted methyltransferase